MTLIFAVALVRVFIDSNVNESGLESMPLVLAEWAASVAGGTWPFFAAMIGALGAFVAGSGDDHGYVLDPEDEAGQVDDIAQSLFQRNPAQLDIDRRGGGSGRAGRGTW